MSTFLQSLPLINLDNAEKWPWSLWLRRAYAFALLCYAALLLSPNFDPWNHKQSDNNWRSVEISSHRLSSATGPTIRWRSGHRSELRNLFRACLSRRQGLRSAARLKILTLLGHRHNLYRSVTDDLSSLHYGSLILPSLLNMQSWWRWNPKTFNKHDSFPASNYFWNIANHCKSS